jgi:hypothetical protein
LSTRRNAAALARERLVNAIEQDEEAMSVLLTRLHERQEELARFDAELEKVATQRVDQSALPSRDDIARRIASLVPQLLNMDREVRPCLSQLVGSIRAVPCQQFDSNLVVLRARFDVRFAACLPDQLRMALQGLYSDDLSGHLGIETLTVDLFDRSAGPRHFARALALSNEGRTLEQIGSELSLGKRQAHIAVQYGRKMEGAGLTDPYVELTAPPSAASRWRPPSEDAQRNGEQGGGLVRPDAPA